MAFVTFPSVEARRAADAAVRAAKKVRGGGRLVIRDERGSKQQNRQQQQQQRKERASEIDVRDVVTPLWRLPYRDQLSAKARRLRGVLASIEAGLAGGGGGAAGEKTPTTPIDFLGILRSPTTDGYRNKCEFTVGLGVAKEGENEGRDGKAECGFCLGAYKDGIVEVGGVSSCRNVSGVAKRCAAAFSGFMRDSSKLPPWDKRHNSGFWRLLIVREGRRETVLPRPREEDEEVEVDVEVEVEAGEKKPPRPLSPPPPFASLDWRPWLVCSSDLAERKEETAAAEGAEATVAAAALGAAASAAAPAAASSPPSPSSTFEPPPADEILLVVQVDPTAPGARDEAALVRSELVALGKALRGAVATYCSSFGSSSSSASSSSFSSPPRSPARLVLQHHSGISNAAPDDAPLLPWPGEEEGEGGEGENERGSITDVLCGLRFRVSPSSFFQVNSGAAALLYRLALDWAGLKKKKCWGAAEDGEAEEEKKSGVDCVNTTAAGKDEAATKDDGDGGGGFVFLDVCCGTGTIGICAAAAGATRVVGVDVVEAAVRDAEANARANGLSLLSSCPFSSAPSPSSSAPSPSSSKAPSCRFVAAKAEDVLASLLREEGGRGGGGPEENEKSHRFVAIVDPPRAGLHPKVRSALRGCPAVSRIVYVSCNPDTLASDSIHLCTRGGNGRAFAPVKAAAADLFPMTKHCEAVLLLQR